MSSAYYELYLKGILNLVGTMVVKSEVSAMAINTRLMSQLYEVDITDPRTWKYYLNLAGKYHHTDTPMLAKSLDTAEEIPFTVEALKLHRATQREYTYNSRYYNELVSRYPDQEGLILGILNPVDIDTAIAAKDHTILYYDKSLVETGEFDLIPRLQEWIHALYMRWDVPDYAYTESLYVASQMALMFAFMPKQIMNIRLDNCKTDRAHSYHIRQYLTSFGRLDPYLDFMNRKQLLFFYRNIRYLNLNAGKQETFELLTEKVMTDRFFPLAEYTIRNNNETLDEDNYPVVELRRRSINGLNSALGSDVKTVREILELEYSLARGNPDVLLDAALEIPQQMKNSLSSQLGTKVLESNVLDKTDAEPFTLTDVIFNNWIYLANTGRYNSVFTLTNPTTGEDLYLTAKEMFILWLYVYNKARGVRLPTVPDIIAKRVRRVALPSREELREMVEAKYVPEMFISQALDNQPVIRSYISVDAFTEICRDIHRAAARHRDLATYQHHYITRGQVEQMTDRFYMDYTCSLADEIAYDEWLNSHSLFLENMAEADLDLLAINIYSLATGQDLTVTKSLQDIHSAHLKLMSQLSSYSIQVIQQINTSTLKIEDWTYIRLGDHESKAYDFTQVRLHPTTIQDWRVRAKPAAFQASPRVDVFNNVVYQRDQIFLPLQLETTLLTSANGKVQQRLPVITNTLLATDPVDLSTLPTNTTAVGYGAIDYLTINDMFAVVESEHYAPLTQWEKNILSART